MAAMRSPTGTPTFSAVSSSLSRAAPRSAAFAPSVKRRKTFLALAFTSGVIPVGGRTTGRKMMRGFWGRPVCEPMLSVMRVLTAALTGVLTLSAVLTAGPALTRELTCSGVLTADWTRARARLSRISSRM